MHVGPAAPMANRLGRGGPDVLVVEPPVVVVVLPPAVVLVVDPGFVVVVPPSVVVVRCTVVVVPPGGVGHSLTLGSGWPVSKAMATERPWRSLKNEPMPVKFFNELMSTEIGLSPVCNRSSTPGLPTYLHTKTLCGGLAVVVVLALVVVGPVVVVALVVVGPDVVVDAFVVVVGPAVVVTSRGVVVGDAVVVGAFVVVGYDLCVVVTSRGVVVGLSVVVVVAFAVVVG